MSKQDMSRKDENKRIRLEIIMSQSIEEDFVTAFTDLGVGGIDALYISNTIGNYLINSRQEKYITIPSEVVSKSEGIVVGLKKDNVELRDKINSALKELESEGRLKEISEKWFGTDMINLEER